LAEFVDSPKVEILGAYGWDPSAALPTKEQGGIAEQLVGDPITDASSDSSWAMINEHLSDTSPAAGPDSDESDWGVEDEMPTSQKERSVRSSIQQDMLYTLATRQQPAAATIKQSPAPAQKSKQFDPNDLGDDWD
jgi:hypothetical protein